MSFMLHSGSYFKRKMSDNPSDEEITTPDTSESSSTLSDYEGIMSFFSSYQLTNELCLTVAASLKRQKCTASSSDPIYTDCKNSISTVY